MALHTFYQPHVTMHDLHSRDLVERVISVSVSYGEVTVWYCHFDGICISHMQNKFAGHYHIEKSNDLDVVSLEFNLKGNYIIRHFGNVYKTKSPQHNIIYSTGTHNTFENAELLGETFKIQFALPLFLRMVKDSNDTLKRFTDKLLEGKPVVIAQHSLIVNFQLQQAIRDILSCSFSGGLKKLFLLSKSIEILVLQAEAYHQVANSQPVIYRRAEDNERIVYAKEYLIQHVNNPPSLSELSKIIGLNEYKLKRGFKETFNTTVFGYLSDYRLDKAKQQLLEKNQSVSEVAYALGYSSPQHFSNAFKKKFGVAPKLVKH